MTEPPNVSPPGVPRWVKVFGLVLAVLVLLTVVVMLASDGRHGPGRHLSAPGTASGWTAAGSVRAEPATATATVTRGGRR